jgi:hypothetical protein
MRLLISPLTVLMAILLTACAGGAGSAAPDFTTRDINGNIHTLSAYQGKVVLLDFWAVW